MSEQLQIAAFTGLALFWCGLGCWIDTRHAQPKPWPKKETP